MTKWNDGVVAKAAKETRAKAEEADKLPRGFNSDEAKAKVETATKMVAAKYDMSPTAIASYLREVGAGRILALYNFEVKADAPAKKGKKGAKK